MKNNEEHLEEEKKCKRCGCKIYSQDSIEAEYCIDCANHNKDARKAWEDKGLAKFCSSCGQMLHAQDSIKIGKCASCQITDKVRSNILNKWQKVLQKVLNILIFRQLAISI